MDGLQARTRWMALLALFVFAVMMLLFALQLAAIDAQVEDRPDLWAHFLPTPFYLYAVGAVWWALRSISAGKGFAPQVARLLRRVGLALAVGGMIELVGQNLLPVFLTRAPLFELDSTAIAIAIVGAGLWAMSELIDEARAARDELDSFV
ncbi:DUF2975 domain-containing protein [Sphingomicrobium astaxanthinifaciens]|nr:DUF2975 domain-containing protein [Sphingomicrobium astaxanthinifaciens]MCJ7422317.1 DUF2975 domain-containing protein [Sphingomicrobium astaxanthinifaciens]